MQYFNFRRLINKYMCNFTLKKPSKGSYVGGQYQQGSIEEIELTGAILSTTATKAYQSGGYYKKQDKRLYTLEPIEGSLDGCKVVYNNNEYSIEEDYQQGNEQFTGVSSYVLRWVSSFD